jgi:uncharacterized protein YbcI
VLTHRQPRERSRDVIARAAGRLSEPAEGPNADPHVDPVVHAFSEHTGRGPTKARTTLDGETVVVILQDCMTKAERSLVEAGRDADVLQLRRTFQETMRVDLIAVVERLTGSSVQVFMSANHVAPDTAAEIFLTDRKVGVAPE